jgi:hypothetical protein
VGPFGDLEGLLTGPGALREKKKRAKRGSASRHLKEVSTRRITAFDRGHLGDTLFAARTPHRAR